MRKAKFFAVLLLILFSAFHAVSAQICKNYIPDDHPDSRYTVHNNGTVTDIKTKLMWKVCSEGQRWNAGNCEGWHWIGTWSQSFILSEQVNTAGFAGYKDWRVPDIHDLASITSLNCVNPTINSRVFPNTAIEPYWSSSPYVDDNNHSWLLHFKTGYDIKSSRDSAGWLRLVRNAP